MPKKSKEIELKYSAPENTPISKKGYFVTPLDNGWVSERNVVNSGTMDIGPVCSIFQPATVRNPREPSCQEWSRICTVCTPSKHQVKADDSML